MFYLNEESCFLKPKPNRVTVLMLYSGHIDFCDTSVDAVLVLIPDLHVKDKDGELSVWY